MERYNPLVAGHIAQTGKRNNGQAVYDLTPQGAPFAEDVANHLSSHGYTRGQVACADGLTRIGWTFTNH